jgi:hypothetical protein
MIEEKDIAGYNDQNVRSDRLAIVQDDETGHWAIVPPHRARIDVCPCCDKPFQTSRAAKLVANIVYPFAS